MTGTTGDGRAALDGHDARLLLALAQDPRATVLALAERVGLSRNTVQARLAKLDRLGALDTFERRVDPAALGYPLTAFVTVRVVQRELAAVADALDRVPEVLEVHGVSGPEDLLVHLVARDADDLYRIAGHLLAIGGVERTSTSLVMRSLVGFRTAPLLRRLTDGGAGAPVVHPAPLPSRR
ncbi:MULTISPECIES: Lrp/AsnC family transcriptional regulator [Pseudonocardia]|uniref:Lrp/AsnC family transcriptional regulator n=1 Tax=Pseudonocardia TaxID=1847 RepID=UPI001AD6903D|nr:MULTISPECIES: Lrp/AsnC family transcriptional regulator [Pseudonocardia]MBO4239914.1 AsnC family transcriptional regulator [Pseudonocardia alni]